MDHDEEPNEAPDSAGEQEGGRARKREYPKVFRDNISLPPPEGDQYALKIRLTTDATVPAQAPYPMSKADATRLPRKFGS
mmetsp:Transcript_14232/g.57298  ORF Transcript_14232/g.57298 Transcript_14232/m.57298 type:complete len:80 (+) Transcript_14232:466-705(+)